jgi:hypothetical protein
MADDKSTMTPVQAALAAGLALGTGVVVLLGAPLWAGILTGSAVAVITNKAIEKSA